MSRLPSKEKWHRLQLVEAGGKEEDGTTDRFPDVLAQIAVRYANIGWPEEWAFRQPNDQNPPENDDDLLDALERRLFGIPDWTRTRVLGSESRKRQPQLRLDGVLRSADSRTYPSANSNARVEDMKQDVILYRQNMVNAANMLGMRLHDGRLRRVEDLDPSDPGPQRYVNRMPRA
jgi:hypothetical protein